VGPGFEYELVALLQGPRGAAAAVIELRAGQRRWLQVAVYRVEGDAIAEIWLYEADHAPSAA
jgi:hypothetical protein